MHDTPHTVNGWDQLSLFGDDAYEVVLRIGIVRDANHIQYQVEARNVATDDLLNLWSAPYRDLSNYDADIVQARHELNRVLWALTGPF